MRRSWRAAIGIAATAAGVMAASLAAIPAQAGPARTVPAQAASTKYTVRGTLNGVAAAASNNAWAVGQADGGNGTTQILLVHWNGSAWSRVTRPSLLTGTGSLSAITVVNAKDAWAVGSTGSLTAPHSLLLHWNGSAWSQVTSPAPVRDAGLSGVSATASSGWAVGYAYTGQAAIDYSPLVFRLTGSKWTRVKTSLGLDSTLGQVATTTSGATFAVGDAVGMITGLIARWNGHAWGWTSKLPTYQGLFGLAAGPGGIAFTVGENGATVSPAISEEWTGHAWKRVTVAAPNGSWLSGVTFAPGGTAWAAGYAYPHSLIMRWNGREWARVTSPSPDDQLQGLAFSAAKYGWAAGYIIGSSGLPQTVILHWNGSTWS
jgi:hypothetical protein